MRIYVASSWKTETQPAAVAALRARDHEVYDFRNPKAGNNGFSWRQVSDQTPPWSAQETRRVLGQPVAEEGFALDFDAMKWCDACVMLQPCGRSASLELGWCAGAGKHTCVLLADGQEPELMYKVADRLCTTLDEVLDWLAGLRGLRPTPRPSVAAFAREIESSLVFCDYERKQWRGAGEVEVIFNGLDAELISFEGSARRGPGPHMTPLRMRRVLESAAHIGALAMAAADACGALPVRDGDE